MDMGRARRLARLTACSLATAGALGMCGCTLLVPTRAELPPRFVRSRVSTPAIASKGVLVVGIDSSDAPQAMLDADGRMTGYAADIAYALGDRLGLDVEFDTDASPDKVGSSGSVDVYIGADADSDAKGVSVVGAYLESAPALFTKTAAGKPSPVSSSVSDLSDATIGVQASSAAQDLLVAAGIEAEQKTYSNVNECLEALDAGEVDYVACDATAGAYLSRAYGDIVFAGALDASDGYGIAVRTMNDELLDAVTSAMDEIAADGTLEAIHTAWYGTMPVSIEDALVSGLTTSSERRRAEEEKESDQADGEDTAEGASSDDASSSSSSSRAHSDADDASAGDEGSTTISGNLNSLSE